MRKLFYFIAIIVFAITNVHGQIATYTGSGGSSTAVIGYANETVSILQISGFGTNTSCSSGGLSGITVNTSWSTYSTAGPRAFIQIKPNFGYQLNVTGFTAGLRSSNTGPVCARFAYSLDNGVTWIDDGACHAPNIGGCGTNATWSWSGGILPTAITSTVNGIIVAIFPYQSNNSSGTFQINSVNILGTIVPSNNPPSFTGGVSQSLTLCENATATSINSLMSVNDIDVGQTETWTVTTPPVHGALNGFPATAISNSSTVPPSGLTYTPTTGYSGTDAFTIQVSDGTAVATTTVTVTVNPLPVAGTISGVTNVCPGSTTALTDATAGGAWSSGTTLTFVSSTGVVTGISAGSDIISYTVTNTCGTTVATTPFTVNALPAVFTVSGGGAFCFGGTGDSVFLSVSQTGISYQLYNGAAFISTLSGTNSPLNFGAQAAAGTYTVNATNTTTGCSDTMTGSATIIVNTLPTAYMVTGGGVVCSGVPVHIGLSGSDANVDYQLYYGSSISGSALSGTGGILDFGTFGVAGTYTVTAASTATGCMNSMLDSAVVTIASPVIPSVSIALGSNDTICAGAIVSFSAIAGNEGSTPLYQWSVNNTNMSMGQAYSYTPANGDVVSVLLTSSAACALPDTVSAFMVINVHETDMPYVNALVSRSNLVCEGERVTFTAASAYGGATPVYRWIINGADVASGLAYTYMPTDGDSVYCTMKSNFVCPLSDSVLSGIVHMTVKPYALPSVTITASPGTYISPGETVTLHAVVTNPSGSSLTYAWLVDGIPVPGANTNQYISHSFSYPSPDSITCVVTTVGDVCGPLTTFNWVYINVYPAGVPQISGDVGISIMPNPNRGGFTIKGSFSNSGATDEQVSIQILDMLGKVVYSNKAIAHNGSIDSRVTLSSTIANGNYILDIRSETEQRSLNIVIGR